MENVAIQTKSKEGFHSEKNQPSWHIIYDKWPPVLGTQVVSIGQAFLPAELCWGHPSNLILVLESEKQGWPGQSEQPWLCHKLLDTLTTHISPWNQLLVSEEHFPQNSLFSLQLSFACGTRAGPGLSSSLRSWWLSVAPSVQSQVPNWSIGKPYTVFKACGLFLVCSSA